MSEEKKDGRMKADVTLADVLNQEQQATGAEITDGSYPGTLFGFGEPFKLNSNFGAPRTVFEARFGILDKHGNLAEVNFLLPVPEGGKIHRRSKLFGLIKSIGDASLIEGEDLAKGFKLSALLGRSGVLDIKNNEKKFPEVKGVGGKMAGAKYPTLEECKELLTSSPGVSF